MVTFVLNGRTAQAPEGTTILQAAGRAGVDIPHFCFHPAFPPEGSCRMCLVEVEGRPKLELSCSTLVQEGLRVWTETARVAEARRSVLEFLLIDHPLDCPVCDKAGECDLQDYYGRYGLFPAAFEEAKERRAKKVAIGKTLLLDRERCILCARCVRFERLVTRTEKLGLFRRGAKTEIGIYDGMPVDHHYSGCLAEICPVGAITDADFRFKTRAWFLDKGDSICTGCGRGCAVTIEHTAGFPRVPGSRRVFRVKARTDPDVNGYWICDVGRYGYAQLDVGRQVDLRVKEGPLAGQSSWETVIRHIADNLGRFRAERKPDRVGVIASSGLSNEELYLLKRLFIQDLGTRRVFLVDPVEGEPDGLLLTAERTPNRRGAEEAGLKAGPPDLGSLKGELDLLFVFGLSIFDRFPEEDLRAFLGPIPVKVLVTHRQPPSAANFELILPSAPAAEKGGSFTNTEGRERVFQPVRPASGEALAEWDILLRLARASGLNPSFYAGLKGWEDIRRSRERERPARGGSP